MLFRSYSETFNVTVYANATSFGSVALPLESGSTISITLSWNTTGFAKGNYTIDAYAWSVPSETDISNNNCTDGWVIVSMVGDITGPDGWPDGKVDMRDIGAVAKLFGVNYPSPRYNPNCDINDDGETDMKDIGIVAKHFGQHYP